MDTKIPGPVLVPRYGPNREINDAVDWLIQNTFLNSNSSFDRASRDALHCAEINKTLLPPFREMVLEIPIHSLGLKWEGNGWIPLPQEAQPPATGSKVADLHCQQHQLTELRAVHRAQEILYSFGSLYRNIEQTLARTVDNLTTAAELVYNSYNQEPTVLRLSENTPRIRHHAKNGHFTPVAEMQISFSAAKRELDTAGIPAIHRTTMDVLYERVLEAEQSFLNLRGNQPGSLVQSVHNTAEILYGQHYLREVKLREALSNLIVQRSSSFSVHEVYHRPSLATGGLPPLPFIVDSDQAQTRGEKSKAR